MREIKFRGYDKNKKEMFEVGAMTYADEKFGIVVDDLEWNMRKDVELMQFTGLLDKNGKDIYEGDIIRINEHYEGAHYYEGHIYQIIFESAEFFSTRKDDEYISLFDTVNNHGGELIGNIYENPELLKGL
jgi:uncharacterized phage protein (TIGR01671 family)